MTPLDYIHVETKSPGTTIVAEITSMNGWVASIKGILLAPNQKASMVMLNLAQVTEVCKQVNICTQTLQAEKDYWFALLPMKVAI